MIRINQIRLRPGRETDEEKEKILEGKIRKLLKIKDNPPFTFEIVKCSIDARKKPDIFYSYTVDVNGLREEETIKRIKGNQISLVYPVKYHFPVSGEKCMEHRPVIVGAGPAGLFCGYMLARHGYRPIILERGMDVDRRRRKTEGFWQTGRLDEECNVQFGEGGAGAFSDGKLNTLVKDKEGRSREVLSVFVEAGAPENILYEGKPHIGTDILADVVKNMRKKITAYGGEIYFCTKMVDLCIESGRVKAVAIERRGQEEASSAAAREEIETDTVVLAIGHSARDTFEMLYQKEIPMEAKAFAVGFRVEHPQGLVNRSQYGVEEPESLPPASYKLAAQTKEGRGVYSFCMCPGGYVVNASSEEGHLAVNGMSYSKRDGRNANSAVIVSVSPKDYGSSHPLGGIAFQRKLEKRAYAAGHGKVPVEYYGDFKKAVWEKEDMGREGEKITGQYGPQIKGEWQFGNVHDILPEALNRAFVEGMEAFNRKIPGFGAENVILSGVESRTSSPVRICRDERGQSGITGLYPCGEGAGYAGGIMSAAMDGIRMAEQIARIYRPFTAKDK